MTTERAAWLTAPRARLEVGAAERTTPRRGEVLVRVSAVAVNPLDWVVQGAGPIAYRHLRYPAVLGADVAGEVLQVGEGVQRFHPGDRVIGLATGTDRGRDPVREGAFQTSTVLDEHLTAPVPPSLSDTDAVVLPLALSTAACALFQSEHLGLALPTAAPAAQSGVVLVWGGSTSVGTNAVQLAAAAGFTVLSTASPENHALVRSYGAEQVVDYHDPRAEEDLIAALAGRPLLGAVAIGAGSGARSLEVLRRGGGRKLALVTPPVTLERVAGTRRLFPTALPTLIRLGAGTAALLLRARRAGVDAGYVWGSSLRDDRVGPAIWNDWLPAALADGRYRPAPPPRIVGDGLEAVQAAIDRQRRGVSATKLVVTVSSEPDTAS